MATMLQVKLGVLILVVAVVAGTGNSLCNYAIRVDTTYGTQSNVIVGVYDKDGTGWTDTEPARRFGTDGHALSIVHNKACMDPCRLTLQLEKAGREWLPLAARITVKEGQDTRYERRFPLLQVVTEGDLVEFNRCKKQ